MNGAVAYLDILGFSNLTQKNIAKLNELLLKSDMLKAWIANKEDPCSFEFLLQFSDSIFICSKTPDKLVRFISELLIGAALIDDTPLLYKGGISYGKFESFTPYSLENQRKLNYPMILGNAVIFAHNLEQNKSLKGPRIFIDKFFYKELSLEKRNVWIHGDKTMEIAWPAYSLLCYDGLIDDDQLMRLFKIAVDGMIKQQGREIKRKYMELFEICYHSLIEIKMPYHYRKEIQNKVDQLIKKHMTAAQIRALINSL